ncbi:DUF4134 domain-containing protein [Sphingobacterium faecium]|uniref:DUF4134 domain-containing protein n=1 Tax=Sphingobacterium faecium TaxID=34087 RepID=UPI0024699579|nr:DUF4134 domain-containing protein [Sphingobacterium faecium]MDH5828849.1 DUF4134 domain-containing protein [Sphingobacterium faecium]WGQ17046.1 DUF4134 domain-containing protein [Sphingobacterium faecium]
MKKQSFIKGLFAVALVLFANSTFAQGGAGAISQATSDIEGYVEPVGQLIQAIGAVVGIVGGVRIYNKWNNGDQDVNKELIGWGGACIFLLLVPTIITAFFGL